MIERTQVLLFDVIIKWMAMREKATGLQNLLTYSIGQGSHQWLYFLQKQEILIVLALVLTKQRKLGFKRAMRSRIREFK